MQSSNESALNRIENNKVRYRLKDDEILYVYAKDSRLSVLMDMNIICLVDNHLVVNLKDFVTPKTKHLTAKAKRSLSACCIGIVESEQLESGPDTTLDILLQASGFLECGAAPDSQQSDKEIADEASKIDKEIDRINNVILALPGSFSGSLKAHMTRLGYTEELLSQESWVSLSTIKQYRQKEDKEKTLKTVTALCIGMHLHPWFTEDLLRKAGVVPKATKIDGAYKFLYTFHYKDSIMECNKYLQKRNLPEFKLREKTA